METASDELITEAEKERARECLSELCAKLFESLAQEEGRSTAKAVYHDAVTVAGRTVATLISEESVPIAVEIVTEMLKDPSQHSFVLESVVTATKPVAHKAALDAIRTWSEEKAMPEAEAASTEVFYRCMKDTSLTNLNTAILAGVRAVIQSQLSVNPQLSVEERQQHIDEYLAGDANKAATLTIIQGIFAQIRRDAQASAERAIEKVAAQATDAVAREYALAEARSTAADLSRQEISRLILAEVQRRAARLARERMQEESAKIEEDKRAEYCQEEAKRVAAESVKSITEEIADPEKAQLDLDRAHELALSAANAVAREFSGGYQLTVNDCANNAISKQTIVFLVAQVLLGTFIVWFFVLGGYEVCEPTMKMILPASVYQKIYQSVPNHEKKPVLNDIDDLLDEVDSSTSTATSTVTDTST
ncbi:MAG TPA: hypothetical protein PKZ32_15190, partial [Candidatus Melainabacteria bacterium]|nr:hypothetical protein [Candidatus Melainabacteria bacterium]